MPDPKKFLVLQTAFLGDVILTLPLIHALKRTLPESCIDVVVTPGAAALLLNHPDIHEVVPYDKRGNDKGINGFLRLRRTLLSRHYHAALIPHRSFRSALLARLAAIPCRIGFDTGVGKFLYTDIVEYRSSLHEELRNRQLLTPLGILSEEKILPKLFPSDEDRRAVDRWMASRNITDNRCLVAIAPGTIWNTKRWLHERFIELCRKIIDLDYHVILIGGRDDGDSCADIVRQTSRNVHSSAGLMTLLQSAELIGRSRLLVSNDSAPMHMAVAMQTPVVAIFGATVPQFGFAPYGDDDRVVETTGLPCRPCSIHGGDKCPITTFDCMKNISAERVFDEVRRILQKQVS